MIVGKYQKFFFAVIRSVSSEIMWGFMNICHNQVLER